MCHKPECDIETTRIEPKWCVGHARIETVSKRELLARVPPRPPPRWLDCMPLGFAIGVTLFIVYAIARCTVFPVSKG